MWSGVKLRHALSRVNLIAVHGPWSRVVGFRYLLQPPPGQRGAPQPLWGGASAIRGARFTPQGGFDSIYLAWDPVTALLEVQALVQLAGATVPLRSAPWAMVSVDGIISHVLDLTNPAVLKALGTNEQEMTGAWARSTHPPTQALARAAYDSGLITGIKYGSAKHTGGLNLVVYPDRLVPPSCDYLAVHDPHGNLAQRLGA